MNDILNFFRLKSLCVSAHKFRENDKCKVLAIASSEGFIKVYKVTDNKVMSVVFTVSK